MHGPFTFFGPLFTFIIIIVALSIIGNIVKAKIKANEREAPDESLKDFDRRLERLEERIANIETIVLEREKYSKFSNL